MQRRGVDSNETIAEQIIPFVKRLEELRGRGKKRRRFIPIADQITPLVQRQENEEEEEEEKEEEISR